MKPKNKERYTMIDKAIEFAVRAHEGQLAIPLVETLCNQKKKNEPCEKEQKGF